MTINRSGSPEWKRCIGLRNSHDKSLSIGLTAGISVLVCSNLAFGGTTVLKRRHTSRIELEELVFRAVAKLENAFEILEHNAHELKTQTLTEAEAKLTVVEAAEMGAIPSCDILTVLNEYRNPAYDDFQLPNRWSLLNAFTETAKKYTPIRADRCRRTLARLFSLDGQTSLLAA